MDSIPQKCLNLIMEQIGVVAVTDDQGRYLYVNERWQEDTEIAAAEAVGKYCYDLIEGSKVMAALRSCRPIVAEMLIRTKSGKDLPGIITYMPIMDREKPVGCFIHSAFSTINEAYLFNERLESITREFETLKEKLREKSGAKYYVNDLIGESSVMMELKDQIYFAGTTNSTVLIEGETGTGKEIVAHAVHNCSYRDIFPFVKVNCTAIPENLMESEFFGYEEGTFTGARRGGHRGKFEKAHLGTIFLDEINGMSLTVQPKLLRVLQEKEIERLGSNTSIAVDVRVIAATNIPLQPLVQAHRFRSDLFYRLNIIHIQVPPLRERKQDIPLLSAHLLRKLAGELNSEVRAISDEAQQYLNEQEWPGNVRELQNMIERAIYTCRKDTLERKDFLTDHRVAAQDVSAVPVQTAVETPYRRDREMMAAYKREQEKKNLIAALVACGENRSEASKMLNISRTTLYKKLKKYELE